MSNHQPKFVHQPTRSSWNSNTPTPPQPTFIHTPWDTDPQTSRGIFGVSN